MEQTLKKGREQRVGKLSGVRKQRRSGRWGGGAGVGMIRFRKVKIPAELEDLCEFDRRIFHAFPGDIFTREEWASYESYWMMANGRKIGCSAFLLHNDFDERPRRGSLHIMSTGILPELQGRGLGKKQKLWQIKYAKKHGFKAIVTNMRQSNTPILKLNLELGFNIRGYVRNFYEGPKEAAVVMELRL
jgi:ribosomal protein S18 acetylase RimI-like enzyme